MIRNLQFLIQNDISLILRKSFGLPDVGRKVVRHKNFHPPFSSFFVDFYSGSIIRAEKVRKKICH